MGKIGQENAKRGFNLIRKEKNTKQKPKVKCKMMSNVCRTGPADSFMYERRAEQRQKKSKYNSNWIFLIIII